MRSTARNEAMITDGKGSRTIGPVPAREHTDSNGSPLPRLFQARQVCVKGYIMSSASFRFSPSWDRALDFETFGS